MTYGGDFGALEWQIHAARPRWKILEKDVEDYRECLVERHRPGCSCPHYKPSTVAWCRRSKPASGEASYGSDSVDYDIPKKRRRRPSSDALATNLFRRRS